MFCKYCGTNNNDDATFCTNCGQKFDKGFLCPKCNTILKQGTRFCTVCGTDTTQVVSQPKKRAKKPVKNLKKKVLISVIAVVLIVSIVLGIMYVPGLINRNRTYKTKAGRAQKGTVVTVGRESPVVQAEGISVDFEGMTPDEDIQLKISSTKGASDEEMGNALASYRLTADDEESSEFAGIVSIAIPLDMTDYDDLDVCAAYYDDESSKWRILPHETFKEENKVVIYTDHFTDFALFKISKSTSRFATAALNYTVIRSFFQNGDPLKFYEKLKKGNLPTDSDMVTVGLEFLNFTGQAYEGKVTMQAIMNSIPLTQIEGLTSTLSKIGFGLVLLKASYEYFILDSGSKAAHTVLTGLMEMSWFAMAGAIGGPVAATVAFTGWAAVNIAGAAMSYRRSKKIDLAVKTQEDFINESYLYCIKKGDRYSQSKSGAWYYMYNSPGMNYYAYKAGSDAEWLWLIDKLYQLNKNDPEAFITAVANAINFYPRLWAATPAAYRGNQWRADNDPMRRVEYPSLNEEDERIVTATVRENLRKRMIPIVAQYKKKIFAKMQAEFEKTLLKERDKLNKTITFEIVSDQPDTFYDKYKGATMRFAVPDGLVTKLSKTQIARFSNQWRFPVVKKGANPKLEATYLGYILSGMPDTLNIFLKTSSLRKNLPDRTVNFTFSMPDTVITVPDLHPTFEELIGSYENGTLFIEDVHIGENFEKALAKLQERADEMAKEIGCDSAAEITVTVGKELIGETLNTTMTIAAEEENEGRIYYDKIDLDSMSFKYYEETGRLVLTDLFIRGTLVASYLPNKAGISVTGEIMMTIPGMKMTDYHMKLRATFVKKLVQ